MMNPDQPILSARGLHKEYGKGAGLVRAVEDVTLDVAPGDVLTVPGDRREGELIQGLSPNGGLLNLVLDAAHLLDAAPLARGRARKLAEDCKLAHQIVTITEDGAISGKDAQAP